MAIPTHLAIIMDGNGRWAQSRGRPRNYGHVRGARVARQTIEECANLGIKYLTLYTFSTENWLRPLEEVSFLMRLMERHLKRERKTLVANNVRFHMIGNFERLPASVRAELEKTIEATANNTGLNLIFALSYGGRNDIAAAARALASKVQEGSLNPTDIDEKVFASCLSTSWIPDPDLIIRTSGEFRISNFLLWQSAYSEFHICKAAWPDFTPKDLKTALDSYKQRDRRFGGLSQTPSTLQV